jgi:hypothetical protein
MSNLKCFPRLAVYFCPGREDAMAEYKLYRVGEDGHIEKRIDYRARSDQSAFEYAQILSADSAIDVWERGRHVGHVRKGNAPLYAEH